MPASVSASIRATSVRGALIWLSVRLMFAHAGWQREWSGVLRPPSRARSRSGLHSAVKASWLQVRNALGSS